MRFQAGGAVREGSFYVERRADVELVEALARGELCAVVAPRQMGKSSLLRRAERALVARGVRSVALDLGEIGTCGMTEGRWCYALAFHIARRAAVPVDLLSFWKAHDALSPPVRWARFVREGLARRAGAGLAVLLDEIDVVLGLPFPVDGFFEAVRALHDAWGREPSAAKLAFGFFGVAAPEELIADRKRSSFAVGRVIRLEGFTRDEAGAFLPGLSCAGGDPAALLDAVLADTKGHPYLTQRMCERLSGSGFSLA